MDVIYDVYSTFTPDIPTCGFSQNDRTVVKCKILKDDSPEFKDIPV
jgi:hypothetical protein